MVNRNGLMKRRWEQASYTVEAAFVVPLGFLVLMSLSCLFTGAVKQNNVQMALLNTVQAYGIYIVTSLKLQDTQNGLRQSRSEGADPLGGAGRRRVCLCRLLSENSVSWLTIVWTAPVPADGSG